MRAPQTRTGHYEKLSFRQFWQWLPEEGVTPDGCGTHGETEARGNGVSGGASTADGFAGWKKARLNEVGGGGWVQQGERAQVVDMLGGRTCQDWWGYADYKRCHDLFADASNMDGGDPEHGGGSAGGKTGGGVWFDWASLGLPGAQEEAGTQACGGTRETTFWYGSEGSQVQCHYDTYGYNLVAQLYGRKRWLLFPPTEVAHEALQPTRMPYEESSVFSSVDVASSESQLLSDIAGAVDVTLEPGDMLYVPRQWWHFARACSTSISVNTWVDTPTEDAQERVREALVRLLVCQLSAPPHEVTGGTEAWLNPTEECLGRQEDLALLNSAVAASGHGTGNTGQVEMPDVVHAVSHPRVVRLAADVLLDAFKKKGGSRKSVNEHM